MTIARTVMLGCTVAGLATMAWGRVHPLIDVESIPADMPAEVRVQVERLYAGDTDVCIAAARALEAMGPRAGCAAAFVATMLNDDTRWGIRGLAMQNALVAMGQQAVEPTIVIFQFGNDYARMRALDVFGRLEDPRAVPVIVAGLADQRGGLGRYAFAALAKIGAPALDYLRAHIDADDSGLRRGVILALPAFPTSDVLERLSGTLVDESEDIRAAARASFAYLLQADKALRPPLNTHLRTALRHPDFATRTAAMDILRRVGDDESSRLLAELVNDPDHRIQLKAIGMIEAVGDAASSEVLAGLLAHPDAGVRGMVVDALGRMRQAVWVPRLSTMAADADAGVREKVVMALGGFAAREATGALLQALDDDDAVVRVRAATALGGVRDARATGPLVTALGDVDKGVRLEAARFLALYYTGGYDRAPGEKRKLPVNAAVPLYAVPIRDALRKALVDTDVFVRETAVAALLQRKTPPDIKAASAALDDVDAGLQQRGLRFFAGLGASSGFSRDRVRALLAAPDARVQADALRTLTACRPAEAFDTLVAALKASPDMVMVAIDGLSGYGERGAPHVAGALHHADARVRQRAAETLVRMRGATVDRAIDAALADADSSVRDTVLNAMARGPRDRRDGRVLAALLRDDPARFGDRQRRELLGMGDAAVGPLVALLGDTNVAVRVLAADMLGALHASATRDALIARVGDPDPGVRAAVVTALGAIGGASVSATVTSAVRDESVVVRDAAVAALAGLDDAAAVQALLGLLAHEDWRMRALAAREMGERRVVAAGDALRQALGDTFWYVRQAAAEALGRLGATAAVPALLTGLDDRHWLVRSKSHAALCAIHGEDLGPGRAAWDAWWQARAAGSADAGTSGGDM